MKMGAFLSLVQLPESVDHAFWGEPCPLRTLLDLAVAFDRAQWRTVHDLAAGLRLSQEQVSKARSEASHWTNEILAAHNAASRAIPA